MITKYYRKFKAANPNEFYFDETLYIEKKVDKIGRVIYYMVEEYEQVCKKMKMYNYVAESRISSGLYAEKLNDN